MAFTLPLPVRVAAGIIATGIQVVRALPEEIPAIPVTLVGNAMRLSMKVQQEITTLATRGDELLGGLTGRRPQESPGWATFDEDKAPARPPVRPATTATKPTPKPASKPVRSNPVAAATESSDLHEPAASSLPDPDTTAMQAAAEIDEAVVELATHAGPGSSEPADSPAAEPGGVESDPSPPAVVQPSESQPDETQADLADPAEPGVTGTARDQGLGSEAAPDDPSEQTPGSAQVSDVTNGPAALPGYKAMTLAQVRGHLRDLSPDEVSTLLDYEQSGDNRAPFLTLLSNRLVTLGARES